MYKSKEYFAFLNSKNIIPSAFAVVIGSLISNIVKKIVDDFIKPISKGEKPIFNFTELGLEILNFIIITYVLFIISDYLENYIFL